MSRSLDVVDDPFALPFRFIVEHDRASPKPTIIYPFDFDQDGDWESYQIQAGRDVAGRMSSVLIYDCLLCATVLEQLNFDNAQLTHFSTRTADMDADGILDIVVTYTARDTTWLDVVRMSGGTQNPLFLCKGDDRHVDGVWDGISYVAALADITRDSRPEIFVVVDSGYDLYPRKLICVDLHNREVLWEYDVAGLITYSKVYAMAGPTPDSLTVVFGISSKGNAAKTEDMDDQHSYMVALDQSGQERWRRTTGGVFTSPQPVEVDYDRDGRDEVLFVVKEDSTTAAGKAAIGRGAASALVVADISGRTLDSLPFVEGQTIRNLAAHPRGFDDKVLISLQTDDDTLRLMDQSLRPTAKCEYPEGLSFLSFGDLIGAGSNQAIVRTPNDRIYLVDSHLTILAQSNDPVKGDRAEVFPPSKVGNPERLLVSGSSGEHNHNVIFRVAATPWYTVFSRKPWLASLAAFAPPAIILGFLSVILVQRKRKNAIIERQRDELRTALADLESAQEQLIAAEKSQQARDIAGGVAHEIRNALDPAVQCLSALAEELPESEERFTSMLDLSRQSIARAIGMTHMVRAFGDLSASDRDSNTPLQEVIDQVLHRNQEQSSSLNVNVETNIPDGMTILCSREHAEVLFYNLIRNALESLIGVPLRRVVISAAENDDAALISVTDSGHGVAPANRGRIFNAFFSTKPSAGMGLGLTFSKRIVELYRGTLTLASEEGQGATFVVSLPRIRHGN